MLQTDQRYQSVSSQNEGLLVNADGSVDVYFGPKAATRKGEQLGAERPWQGLVHAAAPLRTARAMAQPDLAAERNHVWWKSPQRYVSFWDGWLIWLRGLATILICCFTVRMDLLRD